jgi:hypothetical protein
MSAAALMEWLGENMPEVQRTARSFGNPTDYHAYMISLTGVFSLFGTLDERCAAYLEALKAKHQAAPQKPAPQIPPPVWDTRPISPSDAMAAVRAMCGRSA